MYLNMRVCMYVFIMYIGVLSSYMCESIRSLRTEITNKYERHVVLGIEPGSMGETASECS